MENAHQGRYLAGTVRPEDRSAAVTAQLDRILEVLDGLEQVDNIAVSASSTNQ